MIDLELVLTGLVSAIAVIAAVVSVVQLGDEELTPAFTVQALATFALATVGGYGLWRLFHGESIPTPIFALAAVLFGLLAMSSRYGALAHRL